MTSQQHTILIVDDDQHILEVLDARLSSAGFETLKASSGEEALKLFKAADHVDMMITDMKMPGMGGVSLLSEVRSLIPELPVICLTAYGTIPDAVRAVKAGAVEYLTKPFDGRELLKKIRETLKRNPISPRQKKSVSSSVPSNDNEFYVGESSAMKALYDLVERVAASDVNVLILGESGAGKECVARLIHNLGLRRDRPFVVVDCGSTPTGLLESELFGHVKGSFTHAVRDKKGLIEMADSGTLFLDEIGNISPEMQTRLLRFLQDRKIRRIGDVKEISVDCRVISATNANLLEDIKAGNFREDLYYRLRVVTLNIPPLRERKADIPLLAKHFTETFCKAQNLPLTELLPETIEWLCNYPWHGNVRELKNALEAGIVLCKNGVLNSDDLQLTGLPKHPENISLSRSQAGAWEQGNGSSRSQAPAWERDESESFSLEDSERNAIIRALKQTRCVQKDAAELLGISRRAIHYKIKKYEIDLSEIRLNI